MLEACRGASVYGDSTGFKRFYSVICSQPIAMYRHNADNSTDWGYFKVFGNLMIKAILFDLDGTLLDRDRSLLAFISVQYDRLIDSLGHIPKEDYIRRFIELDCRGRVWKDKVYQAIVKEFNISSITWENLLEDYVTQFQHYCVPFDGLHTVLDRLKQEGFLLGLITNGRSKFQRRSIQGLKLANCFDVVLISEEEQLKKPQIEIFKRATDKLNVQVGESVFVGDNPVADVLGAKKAGMRAVWKRSHSKMNPEQADAVIDNLSEIFSALEANRTKDLIFNSLPQNRSASGLLVGALFLSVSYLTQRKD